MSIWVIVASANRTRIFEAKGPKGPLVEVKDLVNPEERLAPQKLKSDKPGRAFDRVGGQRHAMGTPVDPKEQVALRFAKEVAREAESGLRDKRFDRLYLAAAPHFLGLLREEMSQFLARRVKGELSRDLTRLEAREIHDRLKHLL